MIALGHETKVVAGAMEIAAATVNAHIRSMCQRAQLANRTQLILWILQNPDCLLAGSTSAPGLHDQPCDCGSPYCLGRIAERLPQMLTAGSAGA